MTKGIVKIKKNRAFVEQQNGEVEEPVPIKEKDEEGNTVITVFSQPVSLATRIKVAELLGKRNGTFSESKKTENVLPVVIKDDLYE